MTDEGRRESAGAELDLADEELRYAPAFVVDDEGAREDLQAARDFVARVRAVVSAQG